MKYTVENNADSAHKVATVTITGEIGYNTSADSFCREVEALDVDEIVVKIRSLGGCLADGFEMYHCLKSHKAAITTYNLSVVASAAVLPYLAGSNRFAAKNAMFIIHNPVAPAAGDAEDHRKTADFLDKLADSIANVYETNTNMSADDAARLMDLETAFDVDEALKHGLATEVLDEEAQVLPPEELENLPKSIRNKFTLTGPVTNHTFKEDIFKLLNEIRAAVCSDPIPTNDADDKDFLINDLKERLKKAKNDVGKDFQPMHDKPLAGRAASLARCVENLKQLGYK